MPLGRLLPRADRRTRSPISPSFALRVVRGSFRGFLESNGSGDRKTRCGPMRDLSADVQIDFGAGFGVWGLTARLISLKNSLRVNGCVPSSGLFAILDFFFIGA